MKLKCFGFNILAILVAMLGNIGYNNVTESNISDYVAKDSNSVADFVEKNCSLFVEKYNEGNNDTEKWEATYVEYKKPVLDINTNEQYVYMDFNDSYGYALVGNEYNFLDFSTTGDLDYLLDQEELLWSEYDGFVYEQDGEYARYDVKYLSEEDLEELSFNYNGKNSEYPNGSDAIEDIPTYIKSRYGKGWYYSSGKSLTDYVDVYQKDYAIYDGGEGNCTLTSFLGIFQYLRDHGQLNNLPKGIVEVDTSKDSFASGHRITNTRVPEIYAKIRESAMNYNYTTGSDWWTSVNMARWGNEALGNLGYKSDWYNSYVYMYLVWSFNGQVVSNIDKGYPVMWNQARGNYSDHSMVVKGYKIYKKDHKIWFIRWSESKKFMEMSDNWKKTKLTTYIDFDGYSNDLIHEGFGTFVVVKDYKW